MSQPRDIADWYWTRAELNAIAKRLGVVRSGSKADLTQRLIAVLEGESPPVPTRSRRTTQLTPPFALDSVVPDGQRMTADLRVFFEQQVGPQFVFDGHMRDFFANPAGRTLADAVREWQQTRGVERPIAPQFEFNRFTREYRLAHPGATAAEVAAAWAQKKARPRTS